MNNNVPEEKIINVNIGAKDGQFVCPCCGSSDIIPNKETGKLKCSYCYSEFDGREVQNIKNLKQLQGRVVGKGSTNIKEEAENIITIRCGGCGAEIVLDTSEVTHARCHWCRSILSINNKLDNGTIPDMILPFKTTKDEAQIKIKEFVSKRRFFAHPRFRKEFTTENIMGVYFPYLIVDGNAHAKYKGQGEHLVRQYTVNVGEDTEYRYDADLYEVEREFDIIIDDLSIESNSVRLDKTSDEQTNNIINSIMPFDTENCVGYQGNYLVGYTSERRDINIDDIEEKVQKQLKDITKFAANETATNYDRGIKWTTQDFRLVGSQWLSAYLPVWLYSYYEVHGEKKTLHYVAVNARTNETMGSIPINKPLLYIVSGIIELIAIIITILIFLADVNIRTSSDDDGTPIYFLLLAAGFAFYVFIYSKYRNKEARHTYEKETKKEISNLKKIDKFLKQEKGLRSAAMVGRNNLTLEGEDEGYDNATDKTPEEKNRKKEDINI